MIITITGPAGSGKSTIAKMLADKLGWPRYYIGGLRRQLAAERGLTLAEYNKLGETDPSTDLTVDDYQKKLGQTQDNFVIEGRTSWFLIPRAVKIFLDVEEREGARRVFRELKKISRRNEGRGLNSPEDVLASHRQRRQSDDKRYRQYYNINAYDKKHHDLVLDTTALNRQEVFKQVYDFIIKRLDQVDKK